MIENTGVSSFNRYEANNIVFQGNIFARLFPQLLVNFPDFLPAAVKFPPFPDFLDRWLPSNHYFDPPELPAGGAR